MIISFSIENFGPIREKQTISFEADKNEYLENYYIIEPIPGFRLLKLILLYGANASGKTTMLQSLEFIRDLVLYSNSKKNQKLNFNPFLFDDYSIENNTNFELYFIANNKRYLYNIEFNKTYIVREELRIFNPNKSLVFKRTSNSEKQLTEIKFGSKINILKSANETLINNTLWNNTVLAGFLKTNIEINELKDVTEWFDNVFKPLISPNTNLEQFVTKNIKSKDIIQKNVVEILKKADLHISDIKITEKEEIIPESLIDIIESTIKNDDDKINLSNIREKGKISTLNLEFIHQINNRNYPLPFDDQSTGTQRFFGLAGILDLLVREKSFIPIDELESSLHPDLYIHFLLMHLVNTTKSQLIATTHNREILRDRNLFRDDAIWFADKLEEGNTEIYSLSSFDTNIIRDTSNVFNAYSIGKLGGVPELEDYYLDFKYDSENE
ncbi:ATP-binding protein [Empedobacter falsenii]